MPATERVWSDAFSRPIGIGDAVGYARPKPVMHAATGSERWYAVHTGPQCEFIARANLDQQGIRSFLPFLRVKRRRKLANRDAFKFVTEEMPLLSRYLFVHIDIGRLLDVNETDGVSTVVYLGDGPLPIPERVMVDLLSRAEPDGFVDREDWTRISRTFRGHVGDHIEFQQDSPFNGLVARITSLRGLDERGEISVIMELLGSERQVSIPVQAIGKIVA